MAVHVRCGLDFLWRVASIGYKVQRAGPGAGGDARPGRGAGMLALHGIFTLVTRHGLEYPRFYERLYQLLTPAAFQARAQTLP